MADTHTLADWRWLATDSGARALQEVTAFAEARGISDANALGVALRKSGRFAAEQIPALVSQVALRAKAGEKFGELAGQLLFTPAGLEQASHRLASETHAARFAQAGIESVADLGAGLGAESIALMRAGVSVIAAEIDDLTCAFLAHNLRAAVDYAADAGARCGEGTAVHADAAAVDLQGVQGVFFDPARRTAGHRNTQRVNPADYGPNLEFVFDTLRAHPGAVKLGPAFAHADIPEEFHADWLSIDGQVREVTLWSGVLRDAVQPRQATVIRQGVAQTLSGDAPELEVTGLAEYLYEPDGAVIRARQIATLAAQLGAHLVSEGIAYLSSAAHTETPFAQVFRVVETLPASLKPLKKALRERGIGSLEIKKRGFDVDPHAFRKQLQLRGDSHATLILTRVNGSHTAILAERV